MKRWVLRCPVVQVIVFYSPRSLGCGLATSSDAAESCHNELWLHASISICAVLQRGFQRRDEQRGRNEYAKRTDMAEGVEGI